MTTSTDLARIESLLDRKQAVPSGMVLDLVRKVKQLVIICNQQAARIKELEAALEPEAEEE
jgi:hypothetical protein